MNNPGALHRGLATLLLQVAGGECEAKGTVIVTRPMTRKNPRLRSGGQRRLEGRVADPRTCRRAKLMRQAVFPNVMTATRAVRPGSP
jgi:hypothetical protein